MGHRRRYSKRDTGGMKLAFRASPGHSQLIVAVVNAACPSAVQLCMTERRQKSLPYEIASGGVSMTNPIAWFVELTVKPGALARFENLTGEMIAATRACRLPPTSMSPTSPRRTAAPNTRAAPTIPQARPIKSSPNIRPAPTRKRPTISSPHFRELAGTGISMLCGASGPAGVCV
jgi:hypothetical protein